MIIQNGKARYGIDPPSETPVEKEKTFGEKLKKAREDRNWSRKQLENIIRGRHGDYSAISEATIKAIENGITTGPRNGTRAILIQTFPELA